MRNLAEFLEDQVDIASRDADAGIAYDEGDGVGRGIRGSPYPHLAALGELERVGDEVAQNLRDLAFIGVERRKVGCFLEHQRDSIADEQRPQHAAQRAEHAMPR